MIFSFPTRKALPAVTPEEPDDHPESGGIIGI